MFEHYTKDQLESVRLALTDRITFLETSKDDIDIEISVLEASITDIDHAIAALEDEADATVKVPTPPTQ